MGLFDDIPMIGDMRVRRQGGFDPAAGQMSIPADPPEMDEEQPELSGRVRVAQRGARVGPLPGGVPPGVWMPPDIWDAWRKGAIDGIMSTQRYFRRGAGSGSSPRNDDDCDERWEREDARCREYYPFGHRNFYGCKTRAADRRNMCYQNGGKPHPDEPPEYDYRDFMN